NVPTPVQPPPSAGSGNTVLKVVLIVIGIIVLLCVIVAGVIGYGVYRVSKAVHKDRDGNVSISTPSGTITTGTSAAVSSADLGVDPYPGASHTNDGSMNMKTPTGSMVTSVFTSSDPVDKVVDFYKSKLGDQASIIQTGTGTMLTGGEKDKNSVMVTITPEDNHSKIVIVHVTNNP
ncbi:MAG TPA: hypothetical protein VNU92_12120, partial [Edaphobacter sp.]|nr:hypothetical protein [Edaphobacter sp.]